MADPVDVVLGFDPGGINHFGWSICLSHPGYLQLHQTGIANNAKKVFEAVLSSLPADANVLASGIEAPMFWGETGDRLVDSLLKDAVGKTFPTVNALKGACTVQGALLGRFLHQEFSAPITETKINLMLALLERSKRHLDEMVQGASAEKMTEHESDAVLSAYAAWSMHNEAPKWINLLPLEPHPVCPLKTPVSFWMPMDGNHALEQFLRIRARVQVQR